MQKASTPPQKTIENKLFRLVFDISVILLTLEIMIRFPVNHSENGMLLYLIPIPILYVVNLMACIREKKLLLKNFYYASALLIGIIFCDVCNCLVPYSIWTKRGMPDWGEYKISFISCGQCSVKNDSFNFHDYLKNLDFQR